MKTLCKIKFLKNLIKSWKMKLETTLSRGRPSLLQSVPDFLNFTLERHADVSAHRRRRSDEDAVTGMTLELLSDTVSSQIGRKV